MKLNYVLLALVMFCSNKVLANGANQPCVKSNPSLFLTNNQVRVSSSGVSNSYVNANFNIKVFNNDSGNCPSRVVYLAFRGGSSTPDLKLDRGSIDVAAYLGTPRQSGTSFDAEVVLYSLQNGRYEEVDTTTLRLILDSTPRLPSVR